jgi:PAS domain S-box-containing protein
MQIRRIIITCLLSLLALGSAVAQDKPAPQRIIRVGGDQNFPPYEFLNADGQPEGYNVDLTKAIAAAMGFEVEFRFSKWAKVKQWLDRGEIDVVEGMAYSPERYPRYEFSLPHSETWRCFFVRKGSGLKSLKDLAAASIVLQDGDVALDYLQTNKFKGKRFLAPSQEDALHLVSQGRFDAAVVTFRHGSYVVRRDRLNNLKPLEEPFAPRFYCYAARQANSILLNDFNNGLTVLKENGKYAEIQNKWLKGDSLESLSKRLFIRRFLYIFIPLLIIFLAALIWVALLRRQISRKSIELQKELEGRLKYESELNREYKMFVNGPVIVYKILSEPYAISYISENVKQFGYEAKDLILQQKKFTDLIFSEDQPRIIEHFKQDAAGDKEFSARQYRIVTANGQICWVFDYTLIVREQGSQPWFYGYMLDITAQKSLEAELLEAKEKAETANIAKGHFLSNISHEIRTPLNGIIGFIQVLQNTEFTPEQKEYMDLITSSGKTLMKIVNDILDFSKMESGQLDLVVTDFNPRFLVDDIIKTFSSGSTKPNVDLRMRVNEKLPSVLYGDMMRLRQILINLLQNALKFTDSGYIEITADVYNQTEDDIRLLFSVRDTGIGIDPMKQRDIFDNFMQADPNVTRKYGGTGLGLSIVKKLVALMGGFIWVESEPNKGSNFFLILSFKTKLAEQPMFEKEPESAAGEKIPMPELNVLLVEDEPINQLVTQKQLERWKINVSLAETGTEAVQMLQNKDYDCILMDVQMPDMDGMTATNIIREKEKGSGRHIPIVAFTASAMAGDRERFLACGMDEYIAKPIDIDYLYQLLKKVKPVTP